MSHHPSMSRPLPPLSIFAAFLSLVLSQPVLLCVSMDAVAPYPYPSSRFFPSRSLPCCHHICFSCTAALPFAPLSVLFPSSPAVCPYPCPLSVLLLFSFFPLLRPQLTTRSPVQSIEPQLPLGQRRPKGSQSVPPPGPLLPPTGQCQYCGSWQRASAVALTRRLRQSLCVTSTNLCEHAQ